jgi:hypothetical protein
MRASRLWGVATFLAITGCALATAAAADAKGSMSVSTTPSLYPAFSTSVSDYVIRCTGTPVTVNVNPPTGTFVSVDGQHSRTHSFSTTVAVTTGQEFTIVATHGGTRSTWYARCLPTGFPSFTSTVSGAPQAQFFLTAPVPAGFSGPSYLAIFDDNGVPVWWKGVSSGTAIFAAEAPNGNIGWTTTSPEVSTADIVNLDGQTVATVSSPLGRIDLHELQFLPNGDYLVEADTTRCCYDFSSWGGSSSGTITDEVAEEVTPSGQVVWSWDPANYINPVVETDPQWRPSLVSSAATTGTYDVFHENSLSYLNGQVLISFRHLDAVYDVNQADGSILWKLGGHQDPQSLTVQNDPVFASGGDFCGQHDARFLPDGTITVHDNGTGCNRNPRGVHYSINTTARTATLINSISDPRSVSSACCGSARLLPGGDWVAAWGFNDFFTELKPSGTPVYTVTWTTPGEFSYRVTPILPGTYTAAQLRAGMNAQFPG